MYKPSSSTIINMAFALIALSILPACTAIEDALKQANNTQIQRNIHAPQLNSFASQAELETYLKKHFVLGTSLKSYVFNGGNPEVMVSADSASSGSATATSASAASASNSAASVASSTNLIEQGVDESDGVKSDGNYMYLSARGSSGTVAYPTSTASSSAMYYPGYTSVYNHSIRVMQLDNLNHTATEIASIPSDNYSYDAPEMYLAKTATQSDLLAVVSRNYAPDAYKAYTDVVIYDVSAPSSPSKLHSIQVDGELVASRRINDNLYLISRNYPELTGYNPYPDTDLQVQNNKAILATAAAPDFIPDIKVDNSPATDLVSFQNIIRTQLGEGEQGHIGSVSITHINLRNPVAGNNLLIYAPDNISNLYVSTHAVYLSSYQYPSYPWLFEANAASISDLETTDIHKIDLSTGYPVYKGSINVAGSVGGMWSDQDKFRFSEFNGDLRVLTSTFAENHRLFILSEDTYTLSTAELVQKAQIPNQTRPESIGKPGESVYSIRFAGDQAYVVTFRRMDPLYIINLQNPSDPFIEGQLTIPGYSDYLHPLANKLLLGVGRDVYTSADWWNNFSGIKLSLFDISNPASPKEISTQVIGQSRDTMTSLSYDHRALAHLAGDVNTGRADRIAIPVQLHDTKTTDSYGWSYYTWTQDGYYLFDIDTNNGSAAVIASSGIIVTALPTATQTYSNANGYERSVITTNGIFCTYNNKVWSAPWLNPAAAVGNQ